MKLDLKEQETIRQYLLGQAPQADSSRLEEQLLLEAQFYEELSIVEDELVEEYLSNKLSPAERKGFEGHFLLATEHQGKVRFARALHTYVDSKSQPESLEELAPASHAPKAAAIEVRPKKRNWFSSLPVNSPIVAYSLAAVALLMVGSISWLAFNNWRQQTSPGKVYLATLTPGLTRDRGEMTRISLAPDIDRIQLRLLLKSDESPDYRAEVSTSGGGSVLVIDDLKPQIQNSERFINFTIPARMLRRDDYQVRVRSRQTDGTYEDVARYQFRVVE